MQLATSFSIYGCCRKRDDNGSSTEHTSLDAERGTYVPPTLGVNSLDVDNSAKSLSSREGFHTRKAAGVGGYAFQIIFQVTIFLLKLSRNSFYVERYG